MLQRLRQARVSWAIRYGYWTFLARPRRTSLGSRIRLAACLLGLRHFVDTVRVRLVPEGVDVWIRPGTTDMVTLAQVWTWRQYDLSIPAPSTIIDGGANVGLSTVFLALKYPQAQIVAVEPEAGNYALLERNARNLPNIQTIRAALWDSAVKLVVTNPHAPENMFQVAPGNGGATMLGMTVPDVLAEHGWDRLGLLKLDIEGAELEVLRSSASWIDRVDAIAIELHDDEKPGCAAAFRAATAGFDQRTESGELDIAWRES